MLFSAQSALLSPRPFSEYFQRRGGQLDVDAGGTEHDDP